MAFPYGIHIVSWKHPFNSRHYFIFVMPLLYISLPISLCALMCAEIASCCCFSAVQFKSWEPLGVWVYFGKLPLSHIGHLGLEN